MPTSVTPADAAPPASVFDPAPPPTAFAVTTPAELAGYRVVRRLAVGAHADVDLGFHPDVGPAVLVTYRQPETPASILAALSALARVEHDHVVRLLDVGATADRRPVAVLERLDPLSLAALLARRGTIAVGEAVTILAPIGAAVDACHDAGVTHGAIDAASVLFRSDGAPVLACFGRARAGAPLAPPARVDETRYGVDGERLAALAALVLGRVDGLPAEAAVEIAAAVRAADRPGDVLAVAAFGLGPATAVDLEESLPALPAGVIRSTGRDTPMSPRSWMDRGRRVIERVRSVMAGVRLRYRVLLAIAAATLVAILVVATSAPDEQAGSPESPMRGIGASSAPPAATPSQAPELSEDDPVAAVIALGALRERCLSAASTGCLRGVDEAGSAAERDDRAIIADPTAASRDDIRLEVGGPELVESLGGAALVRLHDGAGTGPASVLVMRTEAGWRLRDYLG